MNINPHETHPDRSTSALRALAAHRWIGKALAQRAISSLGLLPLYHHGQRLAGHLHNFHPNARIEYAGKLAADIGLSHLQGATIVEIGSGWVPVVPMGLYLLGARQVLSYDLNQHLQPTLSFQASRLLPDCFDDLARRSGASSDMLQRNYAAIAAAASWEEVARGIGFTYHAPVDVTKAALAPSSIDIVYSNLVLEHVTPAALEAIATCCMRLLRPGGLAWHNVDYTDHYSHAFKGLSPINFLRYSEKFWSRIGQNDITYLNRLRRSDYLAAFVRAGLEVASVQDYFMEDARLLPMEALDAKFAHYSPVDIRCGSSRFVLRKAG